MLPPFLYLTKRNEGKCYVGAKLIVVLAIIFRLLNRNVFCTNLMKEILSTKFEGVKSYGSLSYSTEDVRDLSLIQHINKIPLGSRSHHNKKSTKVRHPNRFKRWWAIGLLMTTPPSCFRISSRDLRQFTTTMGSWSRSKLYNSFTRAPSIKENKDLRFRRKASGSQG